MANLPGSIKNLNTLLGEQLTEGGGGGGAEVIYATPAAETYPLTESQIAANIAVWQKAKDAYEQGKTLPPVIIDLSSAYSAISNSNMAYVINPIQLIGGQDTGELGFGLAVFAMDYMG